MRAAPCPAVRPSPRQSSLLHSARDSTEAACPRPSDCATDVACRGVILSEVSAKSPAVPVSRGSSSVRRRGRSTIGERSATSPSAAPLCARERNGKRTALHVTIPANTRATVYLPAAGGQSVTELETAAERVRGGTSRSGLRRVGGRRSGGPLHGSRDVRFMPSRHCGHTDHHADVADVAWNHDIVAACGLVGAHCGLRPHASLGNSPRR